MRLNKDGKRRAFYKRQSRQKPQGFIQSPVERSRRNSTKAENFFLRACQQLEEKELRRAIELLNVAVRYDSGFGPAWAVLGICYITLDRNTLGSVCCVRAIENGYETADTWMFLAFGYGRAKKFDQAKQVFNLGCRHMPELKKQASEFYFSLFQFYWGQKELELALTTMEYLLSFDPNVCHWGMYSRCCLEAGEYTLAFQAAQKAIDLDPKSGAAYYLSGTARYHLGNPGTAVIDFSTARMLGYQTGVTHNLQVALGAISFAGRN